MPWDIWALLAIITLCGLVIAWSAWGFHHEAHATDSDTVRLTLCDSGRLDLPRHHPTGRHRARRPNPHAYNRTHITHHPNSTPCPRLHRRESGVRA
ncbi:hypothetical protein JK358_36420 [Nocardia sp. 2]|uniref:Secreted protein n=1 Tax=Nocardia acididurans TaxID=2802282 RepID=A0ABS1MHZ3_9NOCA|nr:hypothetical protein [Nocardia acididurans]MBL1079896.1 hypothetical protein [Nocardia acididurans]